MTESPWLGDACSLVDAFRAKDRSPLEELDATLGSIEASELNAFSFIDAEAARDRAVAADVHLPFGGVPFGVKELSRYRGWPDTEASLVFADRTAEWTETAIERAVQLGGVVPVGLTTASEFGGLNVSTTRLNGVTHNPWEHGRTAGGSSGGSASAVAGGLLTMASGGDGGGSIRIPAGFNGLPGLKGTAGRIPRGPHTGIHPMTVALGLLCRSIRDIARYYDVVSGYDSRDPYSLPGPTGWERTLGSHLGDLHGARVAIVADLGVATVRPAIADLVRDAGEQLARDVGLRVVDVDLAFPGLGLEWALGNLASLRADLEGRWPECRELLSGEIAFGLELAERRYSMEMMARSETARTAANEAVAAVFDEVDFIISATNPDVAFAADCRLNLQVDGETTGPENNGALTIPYNIVGNPSLQVPIGQLNGLPVGMQIATRHHDDALLLDLGLAVERERPWPLVASNAPC